MYIPKLLLAWSERLYISTYPHISIFYICVVKMALKKINHVL